MPYLANKISDSNNLGFFVDEAALVAAYPTGIPGVFALLGSTDTFWVWDVQTSAWIDSSTKGPASTITVGTTTTLSPGSSATAVNVGTTENAIINFGIPAGVQGEIGNTGPTGPIGMLWRGAYDNGTTYSLKDGVYYLGSSYINIQAGTGHLPTDAAYWSIIALKGSDGSGSGTVTSVAALTLGTTGTDLSSTVANGTTTPVITLNVPTASATNRGALSSTDWSTFNDKAPTASPTFTGVAKIPSVSVGFTTTATAGGLTTLTNTSNTYQLFTGSQSQSVQLPNATTLTTGHRFMIDNDSTQSITIKDGGANDIWVMAPGTDYYVTCSGIGSAAGTWVKDYYAAKAATGKSLTINDNTTLGTGAVTLGNSGGFIAAASKTLTTNNILTLAGTDSTTITFQGTDTYVGRTTTDTLTNKRITPRVLSATSYTTDTGTSINCDTQDGFIVTAQTGALKFNNPAGTPTDLQKLIISVASSTTAARALTWDTAYGATTVALPTTTAATTATLTIGFIWSTSKSLWQCVAVA